MNEFKEALEKIVALKNYHDKSAAIKIAREALEKAQAVPSTVVLDNLTGEI